METLKAGHPAQGHATQEHPAQGHLANRPTRFGWKGYLQVGIRVFNRVGSDRIGLVAAGVAFFALLALFPGITALIALAGIVLDPADIVEPMATGTAALPTAGAREIVLGQVRAVAGGGATGLNLAALAGLALAIYSASRGAANLIAGLNISYGEDEKRGFFALFALTIAMTLFLLIALSLVLAAVAILPAILSWAGETPTLSTAMDIARWPFLLLVGAMIFTTLYRFGPSRRAARWRWLTPGGILACALWIGATAAFGWYVETLGAYAETFGALAGVIVLLLWLWISAFAVLLGAVIDAELEYQTSCDSTVGPDRPMGERGAVKADTVAEKP